MKEIFKQIRGYEHYSISNHGNVINNLTGKSISQRLSSNGYRRFNVRKRSEKYEKPTTLTTHRVVAEHFIPNPENKPEVNHIDGKKENNHVGNLEWVTSQENTLHGIEKGLIKVDTTAMHSRESIEKMTATHNTEQSKQKKRIINRQTGVTREVIQKTVGGEVLAVHDNCHEAARCLFGNDHQHKDRLIARCARGQAKSAYGYLWEYR